MALAADPAIIAVFVLSALAIAVGSLYAPVAGQGAMWVAALVPWVGMLVWKAPTPLWLAALTAGALAGLATGVVQAAFSSVYIANHPDEAAALSAKSAGALWGQFVGFALIAGTLWGLLSAGLAWVVKRFA